MNQISVEVFDYKHDRNISKSVWNRYIKKFRDKYRLSRDEDGIWYIRCKYGWIELYSFLKHQLCFVGEYPTIRMNTFAMKRLPNFCSITQLGDTNFTCMFDEDRLDELVKVLKIRKKKQLSLDTIEKLRKNVEKARLKKTAG